MGSLFAPSYLLVTSFLEHLYLLTQLPSGFSFGQDFTFGIVFSPCTIAWSFIFLLVRLWLALWIHVIFTSFSRFHHILTLLLLNIACITAWASYFPHNSIIIALWAGNISLAHISWLIISCIIAWVTLFAFTFSLHPCLVNLPCTASLLHFLLGSHCLVHSRE